MKSAIPSCHFNVESLHADSIRSTCLASIGVFGAARAQPTISGENAFWYLGILPSGVYSDGGSCSAGQSGPCYYTQTVLTASPSGGSFFNWSWSSTGAGSATLSCSTGCSNTVTVTATHASSGCSADVSVSVSYNGGPTSAGYGLTIVTPSPSTTSLAMGYPYDGQQQVYDDGIYVNVPGCKCARFVSDHIQLGVEGLLQQWGHRHRPDRGILYRVNLRVFERKQ
jgi:hypothetical protein